jgi:hypothetical protein
MDSPKAYWLLLESKVKKSEESKRGKGKPNSMV